MARVEWSVSNLLSLSRIILLVPILYLLLDPKESSRLYAAALMVVVALTDYLDGYLARKYNQETEFGRIIDPLADKICAGSIAIVLASLGELPVWFLFAVIGRDILILLGGIYIAKTKNVVMSSNWAGKIAMFFVAFYLIFATLGLEALKMITTALLWASTVFLGVSLILYSRRFYENVFAKSGVVRQSP
jgi:CDP-diacylglycerol--glycerol-3-phosphate 3-phosphatidyltransferase